LAAGRYLCAGGGDLSDPAQQRAAVFRYNHSASYVSNVQRWAQAYQTGVFPMPSAPGSVPGTNANGELPTVITVSRQTAAAPPVVAQLDPPAVAQLDQPAVAQPAPPAVAQLDQPAVAQLDAQPATSAATTSSPPPSSLD
ncbi:MAG: lytic transglycosylase domain-containing protein, partial [Pseudonocardiaceae bacterium]